MSARPPQGGQKTKLDNIPCIVPVVRGWTTHSPLLRLNLTWKPGEMLQSHPTAIGNGLESPELGGKSSTKVR
jgi:hypothetical protein